MTDTFIKRMKRQRRRRTGRDWSYAVISQGRWEIASKLPEDRKSPGRTTLLEPSGGVWLC